MKRKVTLLVALLCALSSCTKPEFDSEIYTKSAHYADNYVYTDDGFLYYHPLNVPDNSYVLVTFAANGTPETALDDEIINVIWEKTHEYHD